MRGFHFENIMKKIFCLYGNLFKGYSWELQLLSLIRKYKAGLTLFEVKIEFDFYKSEHKPSFLLQLNILNVFNHFIIYKN